MNLKITLSNNIYLMGLTYEQQSKVEQSLTFENPKYKEAEKYGRSTWSIPQYLELYEYTDEGLAIPRGIAFDWLPFEDIEDQRVTCPVDITTSLQPRDYQERVIEQAMNHECGVIVAPTGAGKTAMAIEIAGRIKERCLILVKSVDLAKQWQAAIKEFTGQECGMIGGGKNTEGEVFTVGLIQTLVKRDEGMNYGMVIVDECHNIAAKQAFTVINRQAAKYRFGLSATPQRRDNLEYMIHAALGPIIAEVKPSELSGAVLPVSISTVKYDFQGEPDSWQSFINLVEADHKRNILLVKKAVKSSKDVGTVILTSTISHAETLSKMINEEGVDGLLLHGQLSKKDREKRMVDAQSAKLIIGTISLLSEGIDWPHIGAIVFATPVSAEIDKLKPAATRLIQSIGRARRPYPAKKKAYVLDIIDNHPFGISAYKKRETIYHQQGFMIS